LLFGVHSIALVRINFFSARLIQPHDRPRADLFMSGRVGRKVQSTSLCWLDSRPLPFFRREIQANVIRNNAGFCTLGIDARPFQLDSSGSRSRTGIRGGSREDCERRNALRRPYLSQWCTLRRKGTLGLGTIGRVQAGQSY